MSRRRRLGEDGAIEVWIHSFSFPHRVAEHAAQAEAWGFAGLLLADSQNLNADVWSSSGSPRRRPSGSGSAPG